jgi:hypothetical protein
MWPGFRPIGRHESPLLRANPALSSASEACRLGGAAPEQEVLELINTKNLGNR